MKEVKKLEWIGTSPDTLGNNKIGKYFTKVNEEKNIDSRR